MTDIPARLSAALAGRYRLEGELGAGGMATVWLAYDLKHDRQVAVKVLHPHLAAVVGADRFLKEIKTTAYLQHPHILPLFDSGDAEGLLFYVMPFVGGESLRQRITREKQLPIADAVRITSEVASALDYAHRQGVIHRDIKPENILLHDGRALVADFGIALAPSGSDVRLTETGMSMGTPLYMSPEQALGERQLDARSDIYSVGAMLYELLTGTPPFTGSSAQAIVAKVLTEQPVPPSRIRRDIPRHVDDAVLAALQKDPADRFATAAALQSALEGDGASQLRSRRRWGWRMKALAAAALIVVAAGAGLVATRHAGARAWKIAVLPFTNLDGDSADASFADGLRLDINEALSQLPGLTVIDASNSRFRKQDLDIQAAGRTLGVDAVLTAHLEKADQAVVIRIELQDVRTLKLLSEKRYNRDAKDLYGLEDSVAQNVATKLGLELTTAQQLAQQAGRTEKPQAHASLVRARGYAEQRTPQAMETAVALFLDALAQDSTYAEAWAGLAQAQNLRAVFLNDAPTPKFDSALSAIGHALTLDSNSAAAHQALGFYHVFHDRNYAEGGRQFARALQLNRNDPQTWLFRAWYYVATDRFDSAVQSIQHASVLDPTAVVMRTRLAAVLYEEGKAKEAEAEFKTVIALDSSYQAARGGLAEMYAFDGQCNKATEQLQHFGAWHLGQVEMGRIPIVWAICGQRPLALRYADSMVQNAHKGEYVSGLMLAELYAVLGDTANVHLWLDQATKDQDWPLFGVRHDHLFKDYYSQPWFRAMLKQLNLPDN
jgi:eukaryotic-like serine/threonine-protein kinase